MKTAVCLIVFMLLSEHMYLLSASDDLFASFFPESKDSKGKDKGSGTTTKGTARVSTHSASRVKGAGTVTAATKAVVTTGTGTSTSQVSVKSSTASHKSQETYAPMEPGEEVIKPKKRKRGRGRKKTTGTPVTTMSTGMSMSTSTPSVEAPPSEPKEHKPKSFDFDALKRKFFGEDDDGDSST